MGGPPTWGGLGLARSGFVQATAVLGYGPPSSDKQLGVLPVVRDVLARLDLVDTIDRLCPIRRDADLTHGQVLAALVANRVTEPAALVRVEDWAGAWAVEEMLGTPARLLNDDRIGRALEALAEQDKAVVGSIGATAIREFGIDIAQVHWDMTSLSLYGPYAHPEADGEYATPSFGHPKDGRTDLRQVQAGLAVTADGGIPVLARAYDGNAAEISQVDEAMRALRDLADQRRFLLVGDRKLVSYTNLTAIDQAGVRFLAPAPRSIVTPAVLATQDVATATIVHYTPAREADLFAHQRDWHRVREGTVTLNGPKPGDPPVTFRAVFTHSARRAQSSRTAREAAIEKARTDLARVHRNLGTRYYRDQATVDARVAKISAERKVGRWLRVHTDTDPDTGVPLMVWHFDADVLAVDRGRRRLAGAADEPDRRRGRRGRRPDPLEGAGSRRAALRRAQGPPRGRASVPAEPQAHPRAAPPDLPGPARLGAHRTRSPPRDRPRREGRGPLRPPPRRAHHPADRPRPRPDAPRARPRRPARLHPPTDPAPTADP